MSGISRTTTEQRTIRLWTEARNGKPARVPGTDENMAGLLRIQFDDDSALEPISWEAFFEKFYAENLQFVYQETTADGKVSRFSRFTST